MREDTFQPAGTVDGKGEIEAAAAGADEVTGESKGLITGEVTGQGEVTEAGTVPGELADAGTSAVPGELRVEARVAVEGPAMTGQSQGVGQVKVPLEEVLDVADADTTAGDVDADVERGSIGLFVIEPAVKGAGTVSVADQVAGSLEVKVAVQPAGERAETIQIADQGTRATREQDPGQGESTGPGTGENDDAGACAGPGPDAGTGENAGPGAGQLAVEVTLADRDLGAFRGQAEAAIEAVGAGAVAGEGAGQELGSGKRLVAGAGGDREAGSGTGQGTFWISRTPVREFGEPNYQIAYDNGQDQRTSPDIQPQ